MFYLYRSRLSMRIMQSISFPQINIILLYITSHKRSISPMYSPCISMATSLGTSILALLPLIRSFRLNDTVCSCYDDAAVSDVIPTHCSIHACAATSPILTTGYAPRRGPPSAGTR